ncbi:glycosyltransferase family 2 protein [Bacillus atrophaeus]|uniref:glycosyltransferase family 2 protein n=1 Tax=Bacillus atrophaeus TaxID=1452 RepID=UPI002DB99402|nr:glycosyltransferase family A protein [Bacillus atrophaeus]MEC0768053.1 glycosyltransferase family A protein [Bacillus atrophaeus]MEC0780494.1 glycosyltransferase family A protein [Bacillus atrophaeus]MEC0807366.1 glycosyltransferase family A protein [Bacillus atrophaeus]
MSVLNRLMNKADRDPYFDKVDYEILNESALKQKTKVSVVVPVYNAMEYLKKTVDSVILQNIGFRNITLILVDDGSKDGSREVLREYSRLYENIVSVFLQKNTGTPAFPRNLGAHLSNSKYITFLDADDWLSCEGVKVLYDLLEETKVNYAVGKTIQVDSKQETVIGRYESSQIRHNVSPFSIKHLFYHLGPRARMMKLDIIKKNGIKYPEMKFAEDKQFFIDVILAAGEISTTTVPIYYLNRIDENESLTKQTDVFEKMDSNISVLKYVLEKNLDPNQEKLIINRLIEFDSITRLFDRKHFVKSKNKKAYYDKFNKVMSIFKKYKRPYLFEDTIIKPISRIYFDLAMNRDFETLEALADWSKNKGESYFIEKEGLPYKVARLKNGKEIQIPIQLQAAISDEKQSSDHIDLKITLKGHKIPEIQGLILQSRTHVEQSYLIEEGVQHNKDNSVTIKLDKQNLKQLKQDGYAVYLRHSDYEKKLISKETELNLQVEIEKNKQLLIYKTKNGNMGIKVIKETKQ